MPPGAKEWSEEDALTEDSFIEVTEANLFPKPDPAPLIEEEIKERDPDNEITVDLVQIMAPEVANTPTPTPSPNKETIDLQAVPEVDSVREDSDEDDTNPTKTIEFCPPREIATADGPRRRKRKLSNLQSPLSHASSVMSNVSQTPTTVSYVDLVPIDDLRPLTAPHVNQSLPEDWFKTNKIGGAGGFTVRSPRNSIQPPKP